MKKLITDACTTAVFFRNKIYKHIDRVSVGFPLGSVLANIIMTDLERMSVEDLSSLSDLIFLYMRYVDDIMLLAIQKDIDLVKPVKFIK